MYYYFNMATILTSNEFDTFRLQRLENVLKNIKYLTDFKSKIHSLSDWKGTLIVNWYVHPTFENKQMIDKFWELHNEYNVQHNFITPC
jgi:hypothetical protein